MIGSKRNKVAIILLLLAVALHLYYSSRLSSFQFSDRRWASQLNAGDEAFEKSEFASAENHYKAAIREAEKKSTANEQMFYALSELAATYIFLDRDDDAEAALQREISVADQVYGSASSKAESARSVARSLRLMLEMKQRIKTTQGELETAPKSARPK